MGAVHVRYYTDPACPWSWAAEPERRRLPVEFGESVSITYVMGGLAREFRKPLETMRHVLDDAAASGMPVDPRAGWTRRRPLFLPGLPGSHSCGRAGPYLRELARA